jgi:hypothetical protein
VHWATTKPPGDCALLRKTLGATPDMLATRHPGYILNLEPGQVDVDRLVDACALSGGPSGRGARGLQASAHEAGRAGNRAKRRAQAAAVTDPPAGPCARRPSHPSRDPTACSDCAPAPPPEATTCSCARRRSPSGRRGRHHRADPRRESGHRTGGAGAELGARHRSRVEQGGRVCADRGDTRRAFVGRRGRVGRQRGRRHPAEDRSSDLEGRPDNRSSRRDRCGRRRGSPMGGRRRRRGHPPRPAAAP